MSNTYLSDYQYVVSNPKNLSKSQRTQKSQKVQKLGYLSLIYSQPLLCENHHLCLADKKSKNNVILISNLSQKILTVVLFLLLILSINPLNAQKEFPKDFNTNYVPSSIISKMSNSVDNVEHEAILEYQKEILDKYAMDYTTYKSALDKTRMDALSRIEEASKTLELKSSIARQRKVGNKTLIAGGAGFISVLENAPPLGALIGGIQQGMHEWQDAITERELSKYKEDFETDIEVALDVAINQGIIHTEMSEFEKSNLIAETYLSLVDDVFLPQEAKQKLSDEVAILALEMYSKQSERMIGIENGVRQVDIELGVFQSKVKEFVQKFTESVALEIAETWEAIGALTKNQKRIQKELNELAQQVNSNYEAIKRNETAIQNNTNQIHQNRILIRENASLIAENKENIEIIHGYLYGTLDVDAKIKALKSGELGTWTIPLEDRLKQIKTLELLKKTETLTSVANYVYRASGLISTIWPQSEAAQKVAEVMTYVATGINVGVGIAELIATGNPMKLIDATFQVVGLFKEEQESIELQYLEAISERLDIVDKKVDIIIELLSEHIIPRLDSMNEKINYIAEQVYTINSNLVDLGEFIYDFYISNQNSFEYIFNELDRINFKQDVLIRTTMATYSSDFARCSALRAGLPIERFEDHRKFFDEFGVETCSSCLDGIKKIVDSENKTAFYMSSYIAPNQTGTDNMSLAESEISTWYEPNYQYFKRLYISNKSNSWSSLYVPIYNIEEGWQVRKNFRETGYSLIESLNFEEEMSPGSYLNYQAVLEIVSDYLEFSSFYDIEGTADYYPMTFEEYMLASDQIKKRRIERRQKELLFFIDLIDQSIAQQSLLSGQSLIDGIFNDLFYNSTLNTTLIFDALENNLYLQQNFLKTLMLNVVNGNQQAKAALRVALEDNLLGLTIDTKKLELQVNRSNLPISFDQEEISGTQRILIKSNSTVDNKHNFSIPIPDYFDIDDQVMYYPNSIYKLAEIRKKVEKELFDTVLSIDLVERRDTATETSPDFYKYLILSNYLPDSLSYPINPRVNDSPKREYIINLDYELEQRVQSKMLIQASITKNGEPQKDIKIRIRNFDQEWTTDSLGISNIFWEVPQEFGRYNLDLDFTISNDTVLYKSIEFSVNTFVDKRDGRTYHAKRIGEETWMTQNLRFWPNEVHSRYFQYIQFRNHQDSVKAGNLYSLEILEEACPQGWELPTQANWDNLLKNSRSPVNNRFNNSVDVNFAGYQGIGQNGRGFKEKGISAYYWVGRTKSIRRIRVGHRIFGRRIRKLSAYVYKFSNNPPQVIPKEKELFWEKRASIRCILKK